MYTRPFQQPSHQQIPVIPMHFPTLHPHNHNLAPAMPPPHCEIIALDATQDLDTSSLNVHIVSPEAKSDLLSTRHTQNQSPSAADRLLKTLTHIAPSVAKEFQPKPTAYSDFVFRLINDVDFVEADEESYVALSYCWSKVRRDMPRRDESEVGDLPFGWVRTVERFPLPTSREMFRCVLGERRSGEGVWFDQVCVWCRFL